MKWAFLLTFAVAGLFGQSVMVYSEFARLDSSGKAIAPENPREILSPAIARNAFASFQIAVQVPAETQFLMYIGQNPENAVKVTMYHHTGEQLEHVELPYKGRGPQIFWMDLWVEKNALVRRIKVEPQVNIDGDWITYPMEVRVTQTQIPDHPSTEGSAPPMLVMQSAFCGKAVSNGPGSNVARLQFRNAQQDVALASQDSQVELKKLACDGPLSDDPEAYLKIRDYLLRVR